MMLKSLAVVFLAAAGAHANIRFIYPFNGTFHATDSSTMEVTFSTVNGLSPVLNWFATIGVSSAALHNDPSELGKFVTNVDFVALGKYSTGTGNFSVTVPVNTTSVNRGSGQYVLTAAIMTSFGAAEGTDAEFFNVTFDATVA